MVRACNSPLAAEVDDSLCRPSTAAEATSTFIEFRSESPKCAKTKVQSPTVSKTLRVARQQRRMKIKMQRAIVLEQLQDLVPHVPNGAPVCQLELLQHVIDYIAELRQRVDAADRENEQPGEQEPVVDELNELFATRWNCGADTPALNANRVAANV